MLSFSHLDNSCQMLKSAPRTVGDCSRVGIFAPRRVGNCSRVWDFAPRRVENCPRVRDFAPRRVWDCFRVGILLRILRHSYGVHPVTLVYQGLRYRLPLSEVFSPRRGLFFYQGLRYRLPLPKVFRLVGAGFYQGLRYRLPLS